MSSSNKIDGKDNFYRDDVFWSTYKKLMKLITGSSHLGEGLYIRAKGDW